MERKNNSLLMGELDPFLYMLVVTKPVNALQAYVEWVRTSGGR